MRRAISTFSTLLLVAFASGCNEQVTVSYATAAEAKAKEAILRGWIPPSLPTTARDIHESHDLDTNRGEGEFHFDQSESASFKAKLALLTDDHISRLSVIDRKRWEHDGYELYNDGYFIIAVSWPKSHACFGVALH
jgi:hypothetical protein